MATIIEKVQSINDGIANVKADFKTALENKGVEVADDLKLKEYPPLLENIQVGGGGDGAYYKCVRVSTAVNAPLEGHWYGIKAEWVDGKYTFDGEKVEFEIGSNVPNVGEIYDSTGYIHIDQMNLHKGKNLYILGQGSGMEDYYNAYLREKSGSQYNYLFQKVKDRKFIDFKVDNGTAKAIFEDGNFYTWGQCAWGDGRTDMNDSSSYVYYYEPKLVDASGNWVKIVSRYDCTWLQNSLGAWYCCGANAQGMLGLGHTNPVIKLTKCTFKILNTDDNIYLYPEMVYMPPNGNRTFLVMKGVISQFISSRSLYVAGYGDYGQLGLGSNNQSKTTFTRVSNSDTGNIQSAYPYKFACSDNHAVLFLFRVENSAMYYHMYAWGRDNYGQLGLGSEGNTYWVPQEVQAPYNYGTSLRFGVACSNNHTIIALRSKLYGAGYNYYHNLGLGESDTTSRNTFTEIAAYKGGAVAELMARDSANMAIDETGKIYLWGNNSGQFGGGYSTLHFYTPTPLGITVDSDTRWAWDSMVTSSYSDEDNYLMRYCNGNMSNLVIPDGVESIAYAPFSNYEGAMSFSRVYIPKSVMTIAANAFQYLYGKIFFEASEAEVKAMADYPFSGQESNFRFGAEFEHVDDPRKRVIMQEIVDGDIGSFDIPEGVTNIGNRFNYYKIATLTIPSTVTYAWYAFAYSSINEVHIGDISDSSYLSDMFYSVTSSVNVQCDWTWGSKPNVENYAPWGATNATIYDNTGAKVYPK